MVVQANRESSELGGHIATFASAATLYDVGFNHFFKGPEHPEGADLVYMQGHCSPGIYARAFWKGSWTKNSCTTSAAKWGGAASLRIRTPGSCRTFGNSPPCPWASVPLWPFTRRG